MTVLSNHERDLIILEQIEDTPDATQASLARQLGVAVGTINWHLKRLVAKGYVKVKHAERRKLRYLITPEGISLQAALTLDYIQNSFHLYRLVRQRMVETIKQVNQAGFDRICLEGEGDVADVCRLTCLEQGMGMGDDGTAPVVRINGLKVFVEFKE
jgi:DNA-binding MarR family transcriptional regulator